LTPDGDSLNLFSVGPPSAYFGSRSFTDSTITYVPSIYAHGPVSIQYRLYDYINPALITASLVIYVENPCRDTLNINNVSALINSYGNQFWNAPDGNHFVVPKSGNNSSLFNFSMWIAGADVNGHFYLAAERYRMSGQDFYSGPFSIVTPPDFVKKWSRVWKLRRSEIEYHKSHWWLNGYTPIEAIATWPGNGNPQYGQMDTLAPYKDVDGNGLYNPMKGDYPVIRGDMAVFSIYNDYTGLHTETQGTPIHLEVHSMAYAFDCQEDSALWNTVFLHLDLYNRAPFNYLDCAVGFFIDGDLGSAWDDYVSTDVSRGSINFYNGTDFDGTPAFPGYGQHPPAQSFTLLAGPYMDPDGEDNPKYDSLSHEPCDLSINGFGFGNTFRDDERLGMMGSRYFTNGATGPTTDPQTAAEYVGYLKGHWLDGEPCRYGGNGHPSNGGNGPISNFMFPALSDPCDWGTNGIQPAGYTTGAGGSGPAWTENLAGNAPGDRRGIAIVGPFTFPAQQMHPVDIAFVNARNYIDTAAIAAIPVLNERIDKIRNYFCT
jgi:hypothetical protein